MGQIVIATGNKGKFKELMEVLGDLPFEFLTLEDIDWDGVEPEENADTYEGNAIIKAEYISKNYNMPAIADDSGIHVDALQGELGVKTRRWGAGAEANDSQWLEFFLERLEQEENRHAEFISVVALAIPGKETLTFRGECAGVILDKPQVELEHGIPLSAVFLPDGKDKVFSAMDKDEKNEISHRGWAIKKCAAHLLENGL